MYNYNSYYTRLNGLWPYALILYCCGGCGGGGGGGNYVVIFTTRTERDRETEKILYAVGRTDRQI